MEDKDQTPPDELEIELKKAPEPPEAEETFRALERILEEQTDVLEELSANKDRPEEKVPEPEAEEEPELAAAGAAKKNVPLEKSREVASRDRLNYRLNYTEQRRLERGEEEERETEFSESWRGKLSNWPGTRWFFDRRTRSLEVVILCGALVALIGVALSFSLTQRDVGSVDESMEEDVTPIENMGMVLLEGREASEEIVEKVFQVESIEELLPLVRNPEIVRPLMEKWYATEPFRRETNIVFDTVEIKNVKGVRYYLHRVYFEDDLEPRPIAVQETEEGYRVDWETVVGYQSIPWNDYRAQRPTKKVYLRVSARLDDYYNFEFSDPQEWSSYRLQHPDAEKAIYGYVKRFSEIDRNLRDSMGRDERSADYMILGVRFPENAQSDHTVHIDEVLQKKWVRAYEPGVSHFDLPES